MSAPIAIESAPAKINLYLHVLGRRADGYHELDSLTGFVSIGDELRVSSATGLSLRIEGPFASALSCEPAVGNLVWRAAEQLAERLGRSPTVALHLDKRLPVASGIGGGSADAAACLRALARVWRIPESGPDVMAVAADLGSDVPVCVGARTSYFAGRGDVLGATPPLPPTFIVLVNPGLPLATSAVFRARQGPFSSTDRLTPWPADAASLAAALAGRRNDLTDAARTVLPAIDRVLGALSETSGCLLARLSGSGPTCFGLYGSEERANAAADLIQGKRPDWWVKAGRFL